MLLILIIFTVNLICEATIGLRREAVDLDEIWPLYKMQFNKFYESEYEERWRKSILLENVIKIKKHNVLYNSGKSSYYLDINQFSDLTFDEFRQLYLSPNTYGTIENNKVIFKSKKTSNLPKTVNWVKQGYVTPVKYQGDCSSSWAFSTTGSMEGQYKKHYGKLISFSEQQLVDCSSHYGNKCCKGGLVNQSFEYIRDFGLESEETYKYDLKSKHVCQYNVQNILTKCQNFTGISFGNEVELADAVANVGPISVSIDADHFSFQLYGGGVYNEPDCDSKLVNHAMLVVGFDMEAGDAYWLVKNSWGKNWGLDGFIKMSKDYGNQCGIATRALYPNL